MYGSTWILSYTYMYILYFKLHIYVYVYIYTYVCAQKAEGAYQKPS